MTSAPTQRVWALAAAERDRRRRCNGRHIPVVVSRNGFASSLVGTRDALGALRDADTVVPLSLADRIKKLLLGH